MSQARVGRIVGLSLGGLWLAISMLAAIAMETPEETQTIAAASLPSAEIIQTSGVAPATN